MTTRPNILLITSDQQHWDTLGVSNRRIKTPALDRLCREGTRFTRAYCPNPVCSPTRASIITGQYPSLHGCWTIGVKLPEDVPTVGEILSANGYRTSLIGKAHFQPTASRPGSESLEAQPTLRDLEFWRGFGGPWYGFDHIEVARNHADESHAGQHYAIWMEERGLPNWRDYFQPVSPEEKRKAVKRQHHWDLPEQFHYTTWTGERTIAQMEESAATDTPFFCWASFHDPHPPYLVSEPWASMYRPEDMEPGELTPGEHDANPPTFGLTQRERPDFSPWKEEFGSHGFQSHLHRREKLQQDIAIYYGMISFIDDQVGRILNRLDELGMAENTIVVYSTDHGHFIGQHGLIAKGAFHYEDMIRLPFIVRYPGVVPAGMESDALQSLVDLAPTFLHYAGLPIPGIMQGVDQHAAWEGAAQDAKVRSWAMVENRHQPTRLHLRTYVDQRYKITVYRDAPYGELFDLQDDPGEFHNRWHDPTYADRKRELLLQFVQADIQREPTRMPRIAGA